MPLGVILGAALVLLGAGVTALSTSFDAAPSAKVLRGNRPVNAGAGDLRDISAHNSPSLARNPKDGANLAVANRIDTPRFSCALHVSSTGGARWSQKPIPVPRGEEPKCYAPDVAFGADGTLYFSFVTLRGRGNVPHAVWIARSRDGGRTLSEPVRVAGPLAFQVRLTADPAKPERLHLTWLQAREVGSLKFTETGNPIQAATSDDGGRTWTQPVRVSSPGRERVVAPAPATGPDGELYVLYLDLGEDTLDYAGAHEGRGGPPYRGSFKLVLAQSGATGRKFKESVVEDRLIPTERFIVFLPPYPSLAVDPAGDRLYAGFQDGRLGDPDTWVWASADRGQTWDAPTRVNDTRERDGTAQYLPKLAVAPDGRLDVVYYDRRSDRRNVMNEVSLQSSSNHGQSFSASLRLSDRPFSSRVGFGSERDLPDLGSRLALLSTDARAFAVWTDTRAGTQASNKQDLARGAATFSEPARISKPAEYALRYGGIAVAFAGLLVLTLATTRRLRQPT